MMKRLTPNMEMNGTEGAERAVHTVRRSRVAFARSVRWLSFWAAIGLPAVYLPLLYSGIGEQTGTVFLGLLGLQLIALLVGHSYNQTYS